MSDKNCKVCYDCGTAFSVFRRKHHCRLCGQIFCQDCSSQTVNGKRYNMSGNVRVCKHCYQLVQLELDKEKEKTRTISAPRLE